MSRRFAVLRTRVTVDGSHGQEKGVSVDHSMLNRWVIKYIH